MYNFFLPTTVFFGKNCVSLNTDVFRYLNKKFFIVTGKNSASLSGALDDVLNTLTNNYFIFDEVTENPTLSTVLKGAKSFIDNNCNFIIAIGGGSPIDAAKAISICAINNTENIFDSDSIKTTIPLIAIPTTSGTGSELTKYSVINEDLFSKSKKGISNNLIFPKYSFIDPKYTISLNKQVTIDTAIDTLSHLLEGVYSINRNILTYPFIIDGIKNIYKYLPFSLREPENYFYREKLSLASLYGGIVIAQSGTTLQHSIGYQLSYKFGISHGQTNAIFMKEILDLYYPNIKNELDYILSEASIKIEALIEFFKVYTAKYNGVNINSTELEQIIKSVMGAANTKLSPIIVSEKIIKNVYEKLFKIS